MMMLAALSMFVVSTAFMALPILVGRGFLESVSFIMLRIGLKRDGVLYFSSSSCFLFTCLQPYMSLSVNLVLLQIFLLSGLDIVSLDKPTTSLALYMMKFRREDSICFSKMFSCGYEMGCFSPSG